MTLRLQEAPRGRPRAGSRPVLSAEEALGLRAAGRGPQGSPSRARLLRGGQAPRERLPVAHSRCFVRHGPGRVASPGLLSTFRPFRALGELDYHLSAHRALHFFSLRCNSHTIKSTFCKCTGLWPLVYPQVYAPAPQSNSTFHRPTKKPVAAFRRLAPQGLIYSQDETQPSARSPLRRVAPCAVQPRAAPARHLPSSSFLYISFIPVFFIDWARTWCRVEPAVSQPGFKI